MTVGGVGLNDELKNDSQDKLLMPFNRDMAHGRPDQREDSGFSAAALEAVDPVRHRPAAQAFACPASKIPSLP